MSKETLLAADRLPEQFDLDELIERLIFIAKIEEGLAAAGRSEFKTHEEVKELVKSWRK